MDSDFMSVAVLLPVAAVIAAIIIIVVFSTALMRRTRRARYQRETSGTVESPRPDQGPMRQPPNPSDAPRPHDGEGDGDAQASHYGDNAEAR